MANNKKDPKEKETITTTAETTNEDLFDVYDQGTINNNNNNSNSNSREESVMNENVNNNNAQAQENTQATTQQQSPVKEKKHMPTWLKYTIAGVIGIGAGIGGTLAVQHFTGDSAEQLANNLFD